MDVELFIKEAENIDMIVKSIVRNIHTYLTSFLGLDCNHLYISFGVYL
jgi:hypothetical protein